MSNLPLRRQREGESSQNSQQQQQQQQQQQPSSTIDRMDDLFNILSSSVNQWYREQQQQVQENTNLQAAERKKLLSMLGHFLKETYEEGQEQKQGQQQQQLQENASPNETGKSDAPVADMELTQSLFHLDKTLESAKSYLRREMLLRLKKKSKTFNSHDHSLLMQCKQSSSGTTATSDSNNINNKSQQNKNENKKSAVEELVAMMSAPPIESVVAHNQTPTFDADAFLFDDDDLDDFEDKKWLSRIFCTNCGHADKLEKTALISHSFSKDGLKYLCTVLLQKAMDEFLSHHHHNQKDTFSIVDVGSRLGIVPVATNSYLQRKSSLLQNKISFKVHGVEIDQEYFQIQKMMFEKAKFIKNAGASSTLQAHKLDITSSEGKKLLQEANFVVMNNVFEFFVDREEDQLKCWEETLKGLTSSTSSNQKKFVVMVPRLEESLGALRDRIVESNKEELLERIERLISFSEERLKKYEIDPEKEMLKIAKFCVGIHDDEECDDEDDCGEEGHNHDENVKEGEEDKEDSVPREDNNKSHHHDCGDDNCGHDHHHHHHDEKEEQLNALMEDFAEIALYEVILDKK